MKQGPPAAAAAGGFSFQPPSNNPAAGFSFKPNSDQVFNFGSSFGNALSQESNPPFTFTSSAQKPNQMNNGSSSMTFTNSSKTGAAAFGSGPSTSFQRKSDPPTPTSEQTSHIQPGEEESDAPVSSADASLLAKKTNTRLRDSQALVVDRSDPTSPLYSLKSFEDLNLKPDLLKGLCGSASLHPGIVRFSSRNLQYGFSNT